MWAGLRFYAKAFLFILKQYIELLNMLNVV